jgi:hypothetical protein
LSDFHVRFEVLKSGATPTGYQPGPDRRLRLIKIVLDAKSMLLGSLEAIVQYQNARS